MERKEAIARELPHLRRYARVLLYDPVEAEDLVQDCVVRALEKIEQWRANESPRLWLFAIMHNLFVDQNRARRRRPLTAPLGAGGKDDPAELPRQVDTMIVADVVTALQALPEERREALVLVGVEGFSYQDAATALGVPVGTLMSRLGRGRAQLRALLGHGPQASAKIVSVKR